MATLAVRYCFEDYALDTDRHELRRNGLIVPAAPQVLDVLGFLIENRDRTVSKDEIVAAVWEGRAIGDSAITTRMNFVRSVVGDSGREQRLIKTLPRKGFRFVGEVHEEHLIGRRLQGLSGSQPAIAVLPLVNLSGDPSQDFFGDVIADDVLTELARLRWLLVIARNSSFMFKGTAFDVREIGRQLDVRYVLEGSARHGNGRARVACRLVDARSAVQIWSERYDFPIGDLFQVHEEITRAIVAAIAPAIIDAERKRIVRQAPDTLNAWESYQRGVWHMLKQTADDNLRARQFFQHAIALDPDYSQGYDGLAWTHLMDCSNFFSISIMEGCERSEPLSRKALALDPENAEARARLALIAHLTGDSGAAIAEADRALRLNPNCADACGARGAALVFAGEPKEGRSSLEKYLRLSPRDPARPIRLSQLAASHYFEQDYQQARDVALRAVQEFPSLPMAYRWLVAALGQLGRAKEGRKAIEDLQRTYAPSIGMSLNKLLPYFRQDDFEHLTQGLVKAGWRQ